MARMASIEMRLAFRQSASLDEVRAFLADVVRVVHAQVAGEWSLVSKTPLPHPDHSGEEVLAKTVWSLGPASLEQLVEAGGGNPRDGFGYSMTLSFVDGERKLTLRDSAWEPKPKELAFTLHGFEARHLVAMREAGRARFPADDTSNVTWAAYNVEACLQLGARELARSLCEESFGRAWPAFARSSRVALQRAHVGLVEGVEADQALAALLRLDPSDQRLGEVATGARTLPGWTKEMAVRARTFVAPPMPDDTGWWTMKTARPVSGSLVVASVARALRLDGPTLFLDGVQGIAVAEVTLADERGSVRGMVHRRSAGEWFTWLWTGVDDQGAVVTSRFEESTKTAVAAQSRLKWLGGVPEEALAAELVKSGITLVR